MRRRINWTCSYYQPCTQFDVPCPGGRVLEGLQWRENWRGRGVLEGSFNRLEIPSHIQCSQIFLLNTAWSHLHKSTQREGIPSHQFRPVTLGLRLDYALFPLTLFPRLIQALLVHKLPLCYFAGKFAILISASAQSSKHNTWNNSEHPKLWKKNGTISIHSIYKTS